MPVTAVEAIEGVYLVLPAVHGDRRGLFVETYRREWFPTGREMVQANRADRAAGCVVGLHYHLHQADYWYVPAGSARVVLHDLRLGSPTEGATWSVDLGTDPMNSASPTVLDSGDEEPTNKRPQRGTQGGGDSSLPERHTHGGVYIPPGVAHGFAALSDVTITYLVDSYYNPDDELGVAWDDPEIAADWGVADPVLSARDSENPRRSAIPPQLWPRWKHPK